MGRIHYHHLGVADFKFSWFSERLILMILYFLLIWIFFMYFTLAYQKWYILLILYIWSDLIFFNWTVYFFVHNLCQKWYFFVNFVISHIVISVALFLCYFLSDWSLDFVRIVFWLLYLPVWHSVVIIWLHLLFCILILYNRSLFFIFCGIVKIVLILCKVILRLIFQPWAILWLNIKF